MSDEFVIKLCRQISYKRDRYPNNWNGFERGKSSQEAHRAARNGMSEVLHTAREDQTLGNS